MSKPRRFNHRLGRITIIIISCCLGMMACSEDAPPQARELRPTDWLLAAETDEERFSLLQQQLRGFDQPMWEVGERYRSLYDALERGNYDMALYQWEKIGTTIRNGIYKRPARAENARTFFLDAIYENVETRLEQRDPDVAWAAFEEIEAACQACHRAEDVAFANDQPLFDLSAPE